MSTEPEVLLTSLLLEIETLFQRRNEVTEQATYTQDVDRQCMVTETYAYH